LGGQRDAIFGEKMPRRHGWLQDYQYALDQGPDTRVLGRPEQGAPAPAVSPVTVNVNINLGDILDKIVKKEVSAKEALNEMIEEKRRLLTEEE
jgi:hypothetical protein